MIDSKMADAYPAPGKGDTSLNLRNEAGFGGSKKPKAGPLN